MKKFCLILVLLQILINNSYAQEVTGDWHGLLEVEKLDKKLRITIHVDSTETGYSATLDSPDQGFLGIPADTLIISDASFSLELPFANYHGLISRKLQTIDGVWKSGARTTTLNFSRQTIEPPEGSIVYIRNQYGKDEKYIVMRDDVRLFTSIYSPKDKTESYPIILVRTPYNIERSEDKYNWRLFYLTHLLE